MRFYRLHMTSVQDGDQGFSWHTSQRDADHAKSEYLGGTWAKHTEPSAEIEIIEVNPTKDGILAALNRYAVHPDNG